MNRKPIKPDLAQYPDVFRALLEGAQVYDSSCSSAAQVIFIDRDQGYYLKSAPRGTLKLEAELTSFFHKKKLATAVLSYFSENERDWMLTERVRGEDCTHAAYLADPERLCDTVAEQLRALHEMDPAECPVPNRTEAYLATAERNYRTKLYHASFFSNNGGDASAEEAWRVAEQNRHLLKHDVLLHGDYCLPNIMLDNWKLSGFIDLGNGGVGDRHIDLFWGVWSLAYNLKTDRYRERFLDAYGRSDVNIDLLRVIGAIEVFG